MSKTTFKDEVRDIVKERGVVIASIMIDCIFVCLWVLGASATEKYILHPLALKGVDKLSLDIFQWISGIATLITIIIYTLKDVFILIIRTVDDVKKEYENVSKKSP